jgi:hypothetical protein
MFLNALTIRKKASNREVIFWGCSEDWIGKTKKILPEVNKIIDIQHKIIGKVWEDLSVISPDHITSSNDVYVVIVSGSFDSIEESLKDKGFLPGDDYCYSPVFEDFSVISEFNSSEINLLFTSSDYPLESAVNRSSRLGGGLYLANINGDKFDFECIYKGCIRQIVRQHESFFAVDYHTNQILVFDKDFNLERRIDLTRRHCTGIAVNNTHIIVLSSSDDVIQFYDLNTGVIDNEVSFGLLSGKGSGSYHINDCWLEGESLFFTYFSKTGYWRNEMFDGGVSVLNISSGVIAELITGLFQPHSPIIHENELYFCESTMGKLFRGSHSTIFESNGFLRGVGFYGDFIVFAQSETLYLNRVKNKNHLMLNSGIYLFNEKSKLARFYPTLGLKNIHQLIVL